MLTLDNTNIFLATRRRENRQRNRQQTASDSVELLYEKTEGWVDNSHTEAIRTYNEV